MWYSWQTVVEGGALDGEPESVVLDDSRLVRLERRFDVLTAELTAAEAGRNSCLLYTSPSPRDATLSRMPSSA